MFILFLCHTLRGNSRQSTEWILSGMCTIPAAENLAHVPNEDRDCVGGWHYPLPYQGIGKASCGWMRTRLSCLQAEQIALMHVNEKDVYSTQDMRVLCSPIRADLNTMAPCSHEEADSRILLHVADTVNQGHKQMIHTSDTDILVLAVSYVNALFFGSLWVAFGSGKNFCYISVHEIAAHSGPRKSVTLRMFHAFTWCDTVSSFGGKKTAWKVWNAFPAVTDVFYALANPPVDVTDYVMVPLERFVIYL